MKLNLSDENPEQESAALVWVQQKRDQIVKQMTDACLNQCLDVSHFTFDYFHGRLRTDKIEEYKKWKSQNLMDNCDLQGESFARIIVQKLKENRHSDLCPFPEI
ncbi:unnamed protein product, partial [Ranitomeya imitator]